MGKLECNGVGKNVGGDSDVGLVGGFDGGFVGKVGFFCIGVGVDGVSIPVGKGDGNGDDGKGCGKTTDVVGPSGTVGDFVDIGGFVCGFVGGVSIPVGKGDGNGNGACVGKGCGKTAGVVGPSGTVWEFVDIGGFVGGFIGTFVGISVGVDSPLKLGCTVGNSTGIEVITEILDATLLPLARFSLFFFDKTAATASAATMNKSRKISAQHALRFVDDTVFFFNNFA